MEATRFPQSFREFPKGRLHEIEVCYFNVNEVAGIEGLDLRRDSIPHYVIGSWFWELGFLPEDMVSNIDLVDEVWAPSGFVRDMLRGHGKAEVSVMPCVVEPVADVGFAHRDFGMAEGPCTYLFHFDAHSTFARKNPFAIIDAYRQAFGSSHRRRDVQLVMKVLNLSRCAEGAAVLRHEIDSVEGHLIEDEMTPGEVAALIDLSDVYVSLHRAEGFGLGIAEAMYFEKPVIATAFSGPVDFVNPANSCMVGYRERTISKGDLYLNPGMHMLYEDGRSWAEPDVAQAAQWMRLLARRPEMRRRIGEQAGRTIRQMYSTLAAGTAIRDRLSRIRKDLQGKSMVERPLSTAGLLARLGS
jgi:glycosyltransferase involved in cell wall biosynthesis